MKVYDVKELAGIFKVNERTVRRWIKENRFKYRKVGRKIYVSEEALKEFFAKSNGETRDE